MPGLARRLLGKKACLCTTGKRDSFYDDLPRSVSKTNEQQSVDVYGITRSDKSRRVIYQANMDESDGDDDTSITEKLRRASSHLPANIPMLVVVSFNPDVKGLQKRQIEIQRGFPVNAQFIQNEWLFVKTADNDEGFVPYVCCRPMLRRQSLKHSAIDMENSYKPYDFDSSKSPSSSIPLTFTPPTKKKLSLPSRLGSQSLLLQNSFPCPKRQDVTSSSCAGDSGFSDCESSSHHHHYRSFDLSTQHYSRSSNVRSLRASSNTLKTHGLIVQDLPLKKSVKINHSHSNLSKSDGHQRIKSQLSISSNSAFTQFVKQSINYEQEQESQHQSSRSNARSFSQRHEGSPTMSSISHLRYPHNSYDETRKYSSPSSKCPSTVSSPYIRRTPFSRRSLPHHSQPLLKKPLKSMLSSSPDPFRTIKKDQQLRHVVLAEQSILPAIIPFNSTLERHFSDLSLNQIENDSLIPSTSAIVNQNRPSLSCSSASPSSSSSTDGSTTAFVHIHRNNSRCNAVHRAESIPFVFATTKMKNNNTTATSSSSFIHNVSITV